MIWELLILGLVPLVIFAFLDYKFSQKTALKGAIITSCLVLLGIYHLTKQIDMIEVASALLLVGLAVFSMRRKDDIYFKMQPGIIGLIFGGGMLAVYLISKQSYFNYFEKYRPTLHEAVAGMLANQGFNELAPQEQDAMVNVFIANGIALVPIASCLLLVHAFLMIHAARKWSTGAWLFSRAMQMPIVFAGTFIVAKIKSLG